MPIRWRMENRVITKTIIPGDSVEDMTFADPLKIKGFAVAIFQEADATMIFGRAILRLFQQIQNMSLTEPLEAHDGAYALSRYTRIVDYVE